MNGPEHLMAGKPEEQFRKVVEADVRNRAHDWEVKALRHRLNAGRWLFELQLIASDIRSQVDARQGDNEWQGRALAKLRRVRGRIVEARAVIAQHKEENREEQRAAIRAGTTVDKKRERAYDAACKRLASAHLDEFNQLLIETHATEGVSLPDSLARGIARRAGVVADGRVDS